MAVLDHDIDKGDDDEDNLVLFIDCFSFGCVMLKLVGLVEYFVIISDDFIFEQWLFFLA